MVELTFKNLINNEIFSIKYNYRQARAMLCKCKYSKKIRCIGIMSDELSMEDLMELERLK